MPILKTRAGFWIKENEGLLTFPQMHVCNKVNDPRNLSQGEGWNFKGKPKSLGTSISAYHPLLPMHEHISWYQLLKLNLAKEKFLL
jgi:hypothetical protein